jgi:hypothetical protein
MKGLLLITIFFSKYCIAKSDTIIVYKDARLDVLTAKQIQLNKRNTMLTSSGLYKGFRLQIISTNNREEAFRIKADAITKFPDQKVYALFQSPNFKIRIGNFLKREDAEKFRKDIVSKYYPNGVYIVEDAIEYVPKEEEINE